MGDLVLVGCLIAPLILGAIIGAFCEGPRERVWLRILLAAAGGFIGCVVSPA